MQQLWTSVVDFVGTPDSGQVKDALDFIQYHKERGNSVYVHCKAGRTRSTTLVACYLIQVSEVGRVQVGKVTPMTLEMFLHWNFP